MENQHVNGGIMYVASGQGTPYSLPIEVSVEYKVLWEPEINDK